MLSTRLTSFIPQICLGVIILILPVFTPFYFLGIVTKILIFAIFAMSLDLIFGYTGLFSLGHAAFFGVAAYVAAILTTRFGIENFWLIAPPSILMAGLLAIVFGLIVYRLRDVYFLLVTFALGELLYSIAMKWRPITGGSDGLPGVPVPIGVGFSLANTAHLYYFNFLAFIVCAFFLYRITKSPFGHVLVGISENEPRMRALGYNTVRYKYVSFILGGLFAGVAGMLHAFYNGVVVPTDLGITTSALPLLMVILGGTRTLWGACIGAAVILLFQYFVSQYIPERWQLILGIFFIITIMYARHGLGRYFLKFFIKEKPKYGSTEN